MLTALHVRSWGVEDWPSHLRWSELSVGHCTPSHPEKRDFLPLLGKEEMLPSPNSQLLDGAPGSLLAERCPVTEPFGLEEPFQLLESPRSPALPGSH